MASRVATRGAICGTGGRHGVVLLVTLVLLVVLAMLAYTLASRVMVQRHRDRYVIDYAIACYGRDSAVKYALATLEDMNTPSLVIRSGEPDFSDIFAMTETEYEQLRREWTSQSGLGSVEASDDNDANIIGDSNSDEFASDNNDFAEPNALAEIRGPYGPPWPLVSEPVEFDIGNATVRIETEDENAKYPLGWAILGEPEVRREARASFTTFCEWMGLGPEEIDSLEGELDQVSKIKQFQLEFKPIVEKTMPQIPSGVRSRRGVRTSQTARSTTIPVSVQVADFAKLFHSGMLDTELLARPAVLSDTRKESALEYLGMWGSGRVNVNSAPRHVLEAAFVFGGDADKIADAIIQRRRVEPFKDIDDLRKSLLQYSGSISRCEKYVTTTSNFFTVRVTAVSGTARASAVIAVVKDGKKVERIAVLSG